MESFQYELPPDEKTTFNNDVYVNMPWLDFNDILRRNDFERVLNYTFLYPYDSGKEEEEFALWAEHDLGLLLRADSGNLDGEKVLHLINLYFELHIPKNRKELDPLERHHLKWVLDERCFCKHLIPEKKQKPEDKAGETFIVTRLMYADGLVSYLGSIKDSKFKPNNPWKYFNEDTTRLADRLEELTCDNNWKAYKEINQNKTKFLPEKTKRMLGLVK